MRSSPKPKPTLDLSALLRGEAETMAAWIESRSPDRIISQLAVIVLGAGVFGVAAGYWRDPLQALYMGVKLPLILLLTAVGNALLNGMMAALLGLRLTMHESLVTALSSFSLASLILGAFAPLVGFVVWNLPPLVSSAAASPFVHGTMMVVLAVAIAIAGVTANLRLLHLLRKIGGSDAAAWRILWAWLGVNLLLGSQISWILRPFIGAPGLPVQFLRSDAFHGSFFETLLSSAHGFFF